MYVSFTICSLHKSVVFFVQIDMFIKDYLYNIYNGVLFIYKGGFITTYVL